MIEIKRLTVRYPFQQRETLRDVHLQIVKGEKVLVLGPSGGGKSTLALTINGIIPRSVEAEFSGDVSVEGLDPKDTGAAEMCRKVGILFQDAETQFCMTTVEDEIAFGLENMALSRTEMDRRIANGLMLTGLAERRFATQQELSGGLKQKLGLACLLAMDQDVLILDEPTANLDPEATERMFALLANLAGQSGKTLIFIEHKLDDLLAYIDRVIVLGDQGRIIADGEPRNIFQHEVDKLIEQGIWVPRLCIAARELERHGMVWETFPLTLSEWETGLQKHGVVRQECERAVKEPTPLMVSETHGGSSVEARPDGLAASLPLLELQGISFSYGKTNVLDHISCKIAPGDFIALLGPNGTGKSTLAQLLAKLLVPNTGQILLNGTLLDKLKVRQLMRKIGFVFQNPEHQFIRDTVEEELAYGLRIAYGSAKHDLQPRVEELLQRFRLSEQRNQNPFSLSQGQKRRLSVASMLTSEQELLILDEPTFGQDYANTIMLMDLLRDLNREGKAILIITHDMELVKQYATRVLLLHEGKLLYDGDKRSLFRNEELLRQASIKQPLTDVLENWTRAFMEVKHA